jgi:hypothetical protein
MDIKDKLKQINESDNFWIGLLRDFIFVISVVVIYIKE